MRGTKIFLVLAAIAVPPLSLAAPPALPLPAPDSAKFCIAIQHRMATTSLDGSNTVFRDMPSYRHSKPSAEPLNIYQVVTYAGRLPIVVSCKMKTAAHLRAAYGERAAGKQLSCPDITRQIREQAVEELRQSGLTAAADKVAAFLVDADEPYMAGGSYLADFKPSYRAPDGRVHLSSPGLFQDYDSWITPILPKIFQGQSYCHLPTTDYLKALASGALEPGTVVTTDDDAPVQPR